MPSSNQQRITIPSLTGAIPDGVFRVADSQVASRWGNILDFSGFDLITPNEKEARFALADQDSGIRPLALNLFGESKVKTLVLKLGIDCAGDNFLVDACTVLRCGNAHK